MPMKQLIPAPTAEPIGTMPWLDYYFKLGRFANALGTGPFITDDTTSNIKVYPTWVADKTGNSPINISSTKLFFNPSTRILTSALRLTATPLVVNYTDIEGGLTGFPAAVSVFGTDTDISLALIPKGAGEITIRGPVSIPNNKPLRLKTNDTVSRDVLYIDNTNVLNLAMPLIDTDLHLITSGTGRVKVDNGITVTGKLSINDQIISTLVSGTAPLVVASTTQVANLNVSQLIGKTWSIPAAIGNTTPNTGAFTTVSATGVLTSTLATGTAPFTVASTTNVANLNASSLNGATFSAPGAIGSVTRGSVDCTQFTATGDATIVGKFGCNLATAQAAAASGGLVTSTGATNVAPYGYTTAAQANEIITKLNAVIAALVACGIMS